MAQDKPIDVAVILAGGVGKRAWPLTATRPKPLLPLPGNEVILSRLARQASRVAREVVVVAPPGERSLFEGLVKGVRVVEQAGYEEGYGSGAAARSVAGIISGAKSILVLNGDLVIHDSVIEMVARVASEGRFGVVGARIEAEPGRYGVLVVEGGRLRGIVEKPQAPGRLLVNAGVYLLPGGLLVDALEGLRPSPRGEYELTDAVNTIASRAELIVLEIPDRLWFDVGTWWDYLVASRRVLSWIVEEGRCKSEGFIDPRAVVHGPICGSGFRIDAYSVVEGPVWLGEGVEIGPFAHIRPYTILHSGASIGAYVEIKASILLEHVKSRHHAYIGDSVVGEGSNIAAGTVFANLRHDGRSVRSCAGGRVIDTRLKKLGAVLGAWVKTGVNSSISPGSRIGPCTWLEEGAIARHDIPACSIVLRNGSIRDASSLNHECCSRIRWGKGVGLCSVS